MDIDFKSYTIEKVGKMIKDSKRKHIWKMNIKGVYFEVMALESVISSMFRVMVQEEVIFEKKINEDERKKGIELEFNNVNLRFKKPNDQLELFVNLVKFDVPKTKSKKDLDATTEKVNESKVKTQSPIKIDQSPNIIFNSTQFEDSEDEDFETFGQKNKLEKHRTVVEAKKSAVVDPFEYNPQNVTNNNKAKNQMFEFKKSTTTAHVSRNPIDGIERDPFDSALKFDSKANSNSQLKNNEINNQAVSSGLNSRAAPKPINFKFNTPANQSSQPRGSNQQNFAIGSPNFVKPETFSSPIRDNIGFNFNNSGTKPTAIVNSSSKLLKNPDCNDFLNYDNTISPKKQMLSNSQIPNIKSNENLSNSKNLSMVENGYESINTPNNNNRGFAFENQLPVKLTPVSNNSASKSIPKGFDNDWNTVVNQTNTSKGAEEAKGFNFSFDHFNNSSTVTNIVQTGNKTSEEYQNTVNSGHNEIDNELRELRNECDEFAKIKIDESNHVNTEYFNNPDENLNEHDSKNYLETHVEHYDNQHHVEAVIDNEDPFKNGTIKSENSEQINYIY